MALNVPTPTLVFLGILFIGLYIFMSVRRVGPAEVGLVLKRFSLQKLAGDNPIAFHGEAGYQADLLMPGLRWKSWLRYEVVRFPWVQVPAGEIGVVISQVGAPLPIGAKSAVYKKAFGNFSDLRSFSPTAVKRAFNVPCFLLGRSRRFIPSVFSWSPKASHTVCRFRLSFAPKPEQREF